MFRHMKPGMSKYSYVVFAVLVFGLNACTPRCKSASGRSSKTVAATFNNQSISLQEIDIELGDSLREARERVAENMAFEAIINEKAKQEGLKPEEFMMKEAEARMAPPTEAEMMALFEANRRRLPPDTTFESVRDEIEAALKNQAAQKIIPGIQKAWLEEANFKFMLPYDRLEIEAIGASKGSDTAKVVIVKFADFGCSFCQRGASTISELLQAYPDKLKVHFRHFAVIRPKASEAALCAQEQGKFWEYHDLLFENQGKLELEDLKAHAQTVALDEVKFTECLDSERHAETIQKDIAAGKKAGVRGPPVFFINGVPVRGALPIEKFKEIIDSELKAK